MIDNEIIFKPGTIIKHERFGKGRIELDKSETAIARFEHGIEECYKKDLIPVFSPLESIKEGLWHKPLEVITKIQASAIRSVNDMWGVFSLSRITLLPHQLWVCRQVLSNWPARWLIADDVGLGKTIEIGLVLWPLISNKRVRRLLILCPASLIFQWQYRLRTMFDIRLTQYCPEADNEKTEFWNTHNQVIASIQTLRFDRNNRHKRFFNSSPWDLVIVDEAHHLNADEQTGYTLTYQLLQRLVNERLVQSLLFLTGTPHRGKNYNFLALLRLLRPDLFDPRNTIQSQLSHLRQVMIRNNKQNVTDLQGKRLFYAPVVTEETYRYSVEEDKFYNMITEFILTGKAYASSLDPTNARMVNLILITMQKLASSSVAAIRRALKGRLERILEQRLKLDKLKSLRNEKPQNIFAEYDEMEITGDYDEISRIEQEIVFLTASVRLMEDEEIRLKELIDAADNVKEETKINKILCILEKQFANRSVVFFTEYKATQSLIMSALINKYGNDCVTFINGDERADDVMDNSGRARTFYEDRQRAAEKFNDGNVRFLVSTEAGGEGIDLQEKCYSLIHIDLPWNPMRLHQRIGRINRYGQKHSVEVINLRNPDTVEAYIWDKLQEKIENIMVAFGHVMEEPEDLLQLVLGMASPDIFRELFSDAINIPEASLSRWFDHKTSSLGGQNVIDIVKDLIGHCSSFDFQETSPNLPRLDLPDLQPFFEAMLVINHRKIRRDKEGISFKTPENWLNEPGISTTYENMISERYGSGKNTEKRILGVGHKLINKALQQALDSTSSVTIIPKAILKRPVIIFYITDRVTGEGGTVKFVIAGVEVKMTTPFFLKVLRDWEILHELNEILVEVGTFPRETQRVDEVEKILSIVEEAYIYMENNLKGLDLPFKLPAIELLAFLWPG